MLDLLLLLIIRILDIPLLENNPFILSRIKWLFLLSDETFSSIYFDVVEENQKDDEFNYIHQVGLYEYNLYKKTYIKLINSNSNLLLVRMFYALLVIFVCLYSRRASLVFFLFSFSLPIIMYYICVLADYHEAIREIFNLMKQIIENE